MQGEKQQIFLSSDNNQLSKQLSMDELLLIDALCEARMNVNFCFESLIVLHLSGKKDARALQEDNFSDGGLRYPIMTREHLDLSSD